MYEEFLVGMFVFVVVWLSIIAIVCYALDVRKTKKYRREVGDLYVAAKIKQIANEDSLDLEEEKEHFMEWWKKNKVKDRDKNYDDVVEDEMMEQVSEKINTKSKKEPKKK